VRAKIVHTLLTLIVRIGQGVYLLCFFLKWWPLPLYRYLQATAISISKKQHQTRLMRYWCWYCICLWRHPILHVWMAPTNHHLGYTRCNTKNHWRSFDAHYQNRAVTVWFGILPVNTANILVMYSRDQITFDLLYLQHQYLLKLCWHPL